MVVLVVLVVLVGLVVSFPEGYVNTPHGMRPTECVIQVMSGTEIEQTPEGLLIINPSGSRKILSVPEKCNQDMDRFWDSRKRLRNGSTPNAWIDNAGWYPPGGNLGEFTATYTVPQTPTAPEKKEGKLYYFIGFENMRSGPVNILQPVLTYEYIGWTYSSWCCCPSNITVQSNVISGFGPGDKVTGVIQRVSGDTWLIDSINTKGEHATLKPRVGSYDYDWADVTFELEADGGHYSCDQLARGPMTFSKLVLKNGNGKTLTPSWSASGGTMCSGSTRVKSASEIVISHN